MLLESFSTLNDITYTPFYQNNNPISFNDKESQQNKHLNTLNIIQKLELATKSNFESISNYFT